MSLFLPSGEGQGGKRMWASPLTPLPLVARPLAHQLLTPVPHHRPGRCSRELGATPRAAAPPQSPLPRGTLYSQPGLGAATPERSEPTHRSSPTSSQVPLQGHPSICGVANTMAQLCCVLGLKHPPSLPTILEDAVCCHLLWGALLPHPVLSP